MKTNSHKVHLKKKIILFCFVFIFTISQKKAYSLELNSKELSEKIDAEILTELEINPSELPNIYIEENNTSLNNDSIYGVNNFEKVTSESITLIGKGLQNRKTGDSVALACVGERLGFSHNCLVLQNVFFNASTHQSYYFGETYTVYSKNAENDPTEKELKNSIKSLNKGFKKELRQKHKIKNTLIGFSLSSGSLYLLVFNSPATWTVAASGGLPIAFGIGVGVIVVWSIVTKVFFDHGTIISPNYGMISTVMLDQNGWNWSEHPKKISNKTFQFYIQYAKSPRNL